MHTMKHLVDRILYGRHRPTMQSSDAKTLPLWFQLAPQVENGVAPAARAGNLRHKAETVMHKR